MKRILIVGTVPYNKRSASRAFAAYFTGYPKDHLAQIFSNPKKPAKGHCRELYQITDQRLLLRRFHPKLDTGVIFHDELLAPEWTDNAPEVGNRLFAWLYRLGSRKSPTNHLLRGILWRKKYWCTDKLNIWMDRFRPDCIFLAFSDDFFIPEIALYAARRYHIPIVSCIGDDYYFNDRFSLSPMYHLYRSRYKKLIRQVFAHGGSAVYISDKIRDLYNREFGLDGQTVYLTSDVQRREFLQLSETPGFYYFGNIGLGRYRSLWEVAGAMQACCPGAFLEIYSNESLPEAERLFAACPNIRFRGAVSYQQVLDRLAGADVYLIVEGFRRADINAVRYSLSTKAADGLASGARLLVYGPEEAGVVSYLAQTGAATVCTDKKQLQACIGELFDGPLQKKRYENGAKTMRENHSPESSTAIFRNVIAGAVDSYEKRKV